MNVIDRIVELFDAKGDSLYGGERVTQREHALQAAWWIEKRGGSQTLIAASLLHDIGHMLHDLPDDAPDQGIDDHHENAGYHWLSKWFGPDVAEPVHLHVAAKRYLCTVDRDYLGKLSGPSIQSLHLQGGPMSPDEARAFEQDPHYRDAVELRQADDEAKIAGLETPSLAHFMAYVERSIQAPSQGA
jgi:phosphonate degradation associated HDIG domain protein